MQINRAVTLFLAIMLALMPSCRKFKELRQDPDIEPLKHGIKTTAAIGYCASLAISLFKDETLPGNVTVTSLKKTGTSGSAIVVVNINESYPLPFHNNVGQITLAGMWTGTSGVFSALFTDIDVLHSKYRFIGLYTIPVQETADGRLITVFAEQDIVIGYGADTLLRMNLSKPVFDMEIDRLDESQPDDVFVAASQNIWFVNINQQQTPSYLYDDTYLINGGGQIAEASEDDAGIRYHALIDTKISTESCLLNPASGTAFIQNIKAGEGIDLGTLLLKFHDECDGKAMVDVATGEYFKSIRKNINLNLSN